jgi:hypothetical protein
MDFKKSHPSTFGSGLGMEVDSGAFPRLMSRVQYGHSIQSACRFESHITNIVMEFENLSLEECSSPMDIDEMNDSQMGTFFRT